MPEKFRIKSINIEGFKGFTAPTEIKLNGKSTFIFGPNGFGKSSILEAISWCLFGSSPGSKFKIRNSDYHPESCKVELSLYRGNDELKLIRKLKTEPDSETSDVRVFFNGENGKLTDVFPQLAKLGGSNANVLLANQGKENRFIGDLKDFQGLLDLKFNLIGIKNAINIISDGCRNERKEYDSNLKDLDSINKQITSEINKTFIFLRTKNKESQSSDKRSSNYNFEDKEINDELQYIYKNICDNSLESKIESLSSMANIDLLEKIGDCLNKLISKEENESSIREKENKDIEQRIHDLREYMDNLSFMHNSDDSIREQIEKLANDGIKNKEGIEEKIKQLKDHISQLNEELINLKRVKEKIPKIETIDDIIKKSDEISNIQKQIEDFKKNSDEKSGSLNEAEIEKYEKYLELLNNTKDYCEKYKCEICPVCDSNSVNLLEKLSNKKETISKEIESIEKLKELRSRLNTLITERDNVVNSNSETREIINKSINALEKENIIEKYLQEVERLNEEERKINEEINKNNNEIYNLQRISGAIQDNENKINKSKEKLKEIGEKIGLKEPWDFSSQYQIIHDEISKQIDDLNLKYRDKTLSYRENKEKINYYKKAIYFNNLKKFKSKLDEVYNSLKKYDSSITSLEEILKRLTDFYNHELEMQTSTLNKKVDEIYNKLTNQPSFPNAKISNDSDSSLAEIKVQVGIADKNVWRDPIEVLNEQAKNAVMLIPYLVFSGSETIQQVLEFLLIDDPSQSFDTGHVDTLMDVLNGVSEHAQIILATHEEEKFKHLAEKYFNLDIGIIKITSFTPETGPTIKYEETLRS